MSILLNQLFDQFSRYLLTLLYIGIFYLLGRVSFEIWKFIKKRQLIDRIPGPPSTWNPLGHFNLFRKEGVDLLTSYFDFLCNLAREYGKEHSLCRFWISISPIFVLFKADSAEKIFSSTVHTQKSVEYRFLMPWMGTGLLTSDGKKWLARRKMLTPAFHFNILETFLSTMNEQAHVLVSILKQKVSSSSSSTVIDVVPLITYAALDIICETTMGVKIDSQRNPNSDYVQAYQRVGNKVMMRFLRPWLWNDFIYYNLSADGRQDRVDLKTLHDFATKVIQERKAETLKNVRVDKVTSNVDILPKKRLAFLDLLIQEHIKNPEQLSEIDMRNEVDTFMFEGHDTMSMSMVWTLLLLGHHPEVQAKVHQEIDQVWGDEQLGDDKHLTSNHLREMKYLEAVIKESLRLFPSVPIISRIAKEDIHFKEYTIPKGSTVGILIYMLHRDPSVFPQPEDFIPERFVEGSDGTAMKVNPFQYVAFSAGSRNCIGQKFALQEEKIMLANVLRHFQLESITKLKGVAVNPELVLRPKEPINIRFTPRC